MKYTTQDIHNKVKKLLYSLTGITLSENKDIMISNRIDKLKRNCHFAGDIMELLNSIEQGNNVTEFINSFTTNKTHFFREDFHFVDLKDRVLPMFAINGEKINMYCSASSTGEEPYSMAMTVLKAKEELKVMQELVMKLKITGTPKIIVVDKTENKIIESIDGANIELIDKYQKENK